jgi:hypothetical protein
VAVLKGITRNQTIVLVPLSFEPDICDIQVHNFNGRLLCVVTVRSNKLVTKLTLNAKGTD